jgi:hypothetical protein
LRKQLDKIKTLFRRNLDDQFSSILKEKIR